jgi:hypothetical protein
MPLWDQDIDRYKVGQKLKITDGWVKEGYRGKTQIGRGRSGKIEVIP